jgi:hypothetical protein
VVLGGNFQKPCVTHMALCHFGFWQYGNCLNKNFIVHGNVHLGWIEANNNIMAYKQ